MEIETIIEDFENDYEQERGPFDPTDFPENKIVEGTLNGHQSRVLTYTVMLDYNRSADQLVENIMELYNDDPRWFDPHEIAGAGPDSMAHFLSEIGFRYPNRDARAWVENSERLAEYGPRPIMGMLQEVDYSAPALIEHLNDRGFLYLKGEKLAPFYTRVLHQHVAPLDDMEALPIPVDTHIRRLSKDLFGELSDDEIREKWSEISASIGQTAVSIDRYLWLIGYNWESGGKEYWNRVVA